MKPIFLTKITYNLVIVIGSILLYASTNPLKAQQEQTQTQNQVLPPKKTAISFVPTYIFRSTLQIGVQRFNKYQDRSFVLYGGITGLSHEYLKETGYNLEAQYRFYVKRFKVETNQNNKAYQQGIYVGVWTRAEQFEQKYDYKEVFYLDNEGIENNLTYKGNQNIKSLSGGIQFGFQQTFAGHFFIDLYVGGGYRGANVEMKTEIQNTEKMQHKEILRWHNGIFNRTYKGVLPRAGFGLGVVF